MTSHNVCASCGKDDASAFCKACRKASGGLVKCQHDNAADDCDECDRESEFAFAHWDRIKRV